LSNDLFQLFFGTGRFFETLQGALDHDLLLGVLYALIKDFQPFALFLLVGTQEVYMFLVSQNESEFWFLALGLLDLNLFQLQMMDHFEISVLFDQELVVGDIKDHWRLVSFETELLGD
jgi:hypothetical protein